MVFLSGRVRPTIDYAELINDIPPRPLEPVLAGVQGLDGIA